MEYTEREREKIHENIEKIRDYLLNIAPQLGDRFEAKFKGNYNYSIIIYNYHAPELSGYIGCNVALSWERTTDHRVRTVWGDSNIDYCVALLENWQDIKNNIAHEIAQREARRKLIFGFEI